MARHRNVRTMNYDEEYEGYDDVYGHSVEDDYSASPSTEHFLYDRNHATQMSAYIQSDIQEEDESIENDQDHSFQRQDSTPGPLKIPPLGEMEQAKLYSCLDMIRDRMGDSFSEQNAVDTILAVNFDSEKALDRLLQNNVPFPKSKPLGRELGPITPAHQDIAAGGLPIQVIGQLPVKILPTQKISAGFSITPSPNGPTKSDGFSEEADGGKQQLMPLLRVPQNSSTQRSTSPADREAATASAQSTPKPSAKSRDHRLNATVEYEKERGSGKSLINLVVVGHVDAGKSTLMGHLLYRLGQVSSKQMHKYEQESKKMGKQSFVYAWVLDETGEERSRGITMDVGQSQFETETKRVTLLDAPGHKDFIPNMIFGAAQADVGLLVVDATTGEFETGFELGGQTREHALLVRSLGVSQLGVAVNKLDMVNWSRERFTDISNRLGTFLKQAGYKEQDIFYVPVSGLTGENLVNAATESNLVSWYTGPTLIQCIDRFRPPERSLNRPFRFVVSDVFKSTGSSSGCCLAGRIESGMVQSGDKLLIMPLNETVHIKSITINDCCVQNAFAGDQVVLTANVPDPSGICLGSVLCDPNEPIKATTRIEARIVIFNIDVPITKGHPVIVHYQSLSESANITKLIAQIHKSTGEVVRNRPRCLTKQTSGLVEIDISRPVCMELYKDYRELGRFMLRSRGATIAAGLVTKIL